MNEEKLLRIIRPLGLILIFLTLIWAVAITLSDKLMVQIALIDREKDVLRKDLEEVKEVVSALAQGKNKLAEELENERKLRQEARENYESSIAQLSSIEKSLQSQQDFIDSGDITKLINEWSPRVARLECKFDLSDGRQGVSRASAVTTYSASGLRFITNKHVVEKRGVKATSCEADFINTDKDLEASNITVIDDADLAYVDLGRTAVISGVNGLVKKCSASPNIGDQVIILGYPSVGAENGITATEGIISGIDDDYYITSAKIEQGNSGGAAVLVKDDCLLGLPTLVVSGRIESLARILPLN